MPWLLSELSRIALRSRPWPIRVDTYPYLWLTGRGATFINKRRIRRGLRDVQESSLYRRDLTKRSTTLSDINYRTLSDTAMKTMAKENADPKDLKRVPKPQMEKRRRDRINQSLETLRLLLLENTKNEKLRNPKVEKAAILESVVQFLKAEQGGGGTASGPQPTGSGAHNSLREEGATPLPAECNLNYRDGMRMCLRRVGHFIAAKNRELEGSMDGAGGHQNPLEHAGPLPQSVIPLPLSKPPSKTRILAAHSHLPWCGPQPAPELDPSAHVPPQRLSPCPLPSYPLEVLPKPGGVTGDAVWRPWPQ